MSDPPTCTLSPAQVQLDGTAGVSSTLTVSTTAATALARPGESFKTCGDAVLAGLVLIFAVPRKRLRGIALLLAGLGVAASGLAGCGPGTKAQPAQSSGTATGGSGTATGSYDVVVTATSGKIAGSATIALTVQ